MAAGLWGCVVKEHASTMTMVGNEREPSLSGNGRLLASIVDLDGQPTVQLRNIESGKILPLSYLQRHQPHSSPSLSWNGRYVAVIGNWRNGQRRALIEDRLNHRVHRLQLLGSQAPVRISLSPDARQLAVQWIKRGQWLIKVLDLSQLLEPDWPAGKQLTTSTRLADVSR
ncbi:Tol biopolymer transporter periplasmic protein [cyanobiont of Ornithocercus magnificus]|nr:Tol biopolymer transporter periplasmic protein [cyanobiont of Ornithocercus magnificus]